MMKVLAALLIAATVLPVGTARGDESTFLRSLEGNWSGTGTVTVRADSLPMKVACRFKSDTTARSLELDGRCTSLAIFSRVIAADLEARGANYSGSYVGAGSGTAGLTGKRSGNAINLGIRWAKNVNGDRTARMKIEKVGEAGLRLTTVDIHPTTGKSIVTSRIDLQRS